MSVCYHKGITIEYNSDEPRLTIEGRNIEVKRVNDLFVRSERLNDEPKPIDKLGMETFDESPDCQHREDAKKYHLKQLSKGRDHWNDWRRDNPETRPLLYDLEPDDCVGDWNGANFANAVLVEADLTKAKLRGAIFHEANLGGANLSGVDLTGANFCRTDLYRTILKGANLTAANLQGTQLAQTEFEDATLVDCKVYGLSAWDLRGLDKVREMKDLIVRYTPQDETKESKLNTPQDETKESKLTVNDLRTAPFIYLLLNNKNIRYAIQELNKKVVLILGRFTKKEKDVLDAVRRELEGLNLVPIIFDWPGPQARDLTETVQLLANMSGFVIADLTDPKSIPQELSHIIPFLPSVPVKPIYLKSERPYAMFEHWQRYDSVLDEFPYEDTRDLLDNLPDRVLEDVKKWQKRADKADRERDLRKRNEKLLAENTELKACLATLLT